MERLERDYHFAGPYLRLSDAVLSMEEGGKVGGVVNLAGRWWKRPEVFEAVGSGWLAPWSLGVQDRPFAVGGPLAVWVARKTLPRQGHEVSWCAVW